MHNNVKFPPPAIALVVAVALLGGACTSQPTELSANGGNDSPAAVTDSIAPSTSIAAASSTADGTESSSDSAAAGQNNGDEGASAEELDLNELVQRVGTRYDAAKGVWPGFVPNEHPVVIALKDAQSKTFGALALNVADPSALGKATALETAGTSLASAHRITDLNEEAKTKLDGMQHFDFHLSLAGVDSFAITAGPQLDGSDPDYPATLLHELFHRWQDEGFKPNENRQDIAGYNYSKENLALAVLEQRALIAAVGAKSDADRDTAARHYAAIRLARTAADDRIILDNGQEQVEGSARYMEHATHTEGGSYGPGQFSDELRNEFDTTTGTKGWFGFTRFYSSGAAAIQLATELNDDALTLIAQGAFPAQVVIDATGVSAGDVDELVAQARQAYDSDGLIDAKAAEASKKAETESGDIFGDGNGTTTEEVGDEQVLTPEQSECLSQGEIGPNGEIPNELFERCVGGE